MTQSDQSQAVLRPPSCCCCCCGHLAQASDITVNFTTRDVTATAGADYTATSGSLTFTPANWAVPQQVTVGILPDVLLEANETFAIDISVAAPFASIADASASSSTVTIRNTLVQVCPFIV
jgi:chitinase